LGAWLKWLRSKHRALNSTLSTTNKKDELPRALLTNPTPCRHPPSPSSAACSFPCAGHFPSTWKYAIISPLQAPLPPSPQPRPLQGCCTHRGHPGPQVSNPMDQPQSSSLSPSSAHSHTVSPSSLMLPSLPRHTLSGSPAPSSPCPHMQSRAQSSNLFSSHTHSLVCPAMFVWTPLCKGPTLDFPALFLPYSAQLPISLLRPKTLEPSLLFCHLSLTLSPLAKCSHTKNLPKI
jgi:hypothetical protein